jgi:hypothetical protein
MVTRSETAAARGVAEKTQGAGHRAGVTQQVGAKWSAFSPSSSRNSGEIS